MCSGERSSSANGAIALRHSAAARVVDLEQQRLVGLDDQGAVVHPVALTRSRRGSVVAGASTCAAFWRARKAATLAREEHRSEQ